jgi:membrane fusion protein (multidrug efflux system)
VRPLSLICVCVLFALTACSSGAGDAGNAAAGGGAGAAAGGGNRGGAGGAGGARGGNRGPAEVSIIVMAPQRAALTAELPGRTVAVRVAQVRPQVSGIIQKRLFTEGSEVKAGQPLYQLDPGIYLAARESAAATVGKTEAQLRTVQLRAERYNKLATSGMISQQDRDDVMASLAQAEADVGTAKAALRSAEVNLAYTHIVAPISGRIDVSNVTEGALVTANQTAELTTVQQLDPIFVDFTQSADELLRLRQQFTSGSLTRVSGNRAQVHVILGDGSVYPRPGLLEFTGVSVSSGTGAITLRASVPNPERQLLPGMFVRAVLDQGISDAALLAPQRSVQRDENGDPTAFVVDADGKVRQRALKTGGTVGDSWLVTAGLAAGDRLVVEGMQKIKEGDAVKIAGGGAADASARGAGPGRSGGPGRAGGAPAGAP